MQIYCLLHASFIFAKKETSVSPVSEVELRMQIAEAKIFIFKNLQTCIPWVHQ